MANGPFALRPGSAVITKRPASITDIRSPHTRVNMPSSANAPPTSCTAAAPHANSTGNGIDARSTRSANV